MILRYTSVRHAGFDEVSRDFLSEICLCWAGIEKALIEASKRIRELRRQHPTLYVQVTPHSFK